MPARSVWLACRSRTFTICARVQAIKPNAPASPRLTPCATPLACAPHGCSLRCGSRLRNRARGYRLAPARCGRARVTSAARPAPGARAALRPMRRAAVASCSPARAKLHRPPRPQHQPRADAWANPIGSTPGCGQWSAARWKTAHSPGSLGRGLCCLPQPIQRPPPSTGQTSNRRLDQFTSKKGNRNLTRNTTSCSVNICSTVMQSH